MLAQRCKLIFNPAAAQGKAAGRLAEVEALLRARGIDYELHLTKAVGHAIELAREAAREGFSTLASAGGDGTTNEVINGLMAADARGDTIPALAVLGIGRGNDFEYGAGLPSSLAESVGLLAAGSSRLVDVGLVTGGDYPRGRYFGNGIGIGFDTIVGLAAAKMRRVHGFMGYVLGALRTMAVYPEAPEVTVAFDSRILGQRSHQISIMNGKRMGGTFYMAPSADIRDGLLDLCMAESLTRREMLGLVVRYTKGTQATHPKVRTERSSRFEVLAPAGGLVVHADGETICTNGTNIVAECLGSKLRLLCADEGAPVS
ncbi:MAG TPA: YegS/Rv2252/BmrU family lipid kinase [Rectinemataceae bacterium]|nr:YegS/Rv2252/BmrU family lipid kinase [Rectinemataceae bacterium]